MGADVVVVNGTYPTYLTSPPAVSLLDAICMRKIGLKHTTEPTEEESQTKKLRTEDSLIPEQQFLARNKGPVQLSIAVPMMAEKAEWKLHGQILNITLQGSDTVATMKALIHKQTGMPPGKQKLQYELVPRQHQQDVYDSDQQQQYYRPHRLNYNHHHNHYNHRHPHHYLHRHHRRHHRSSSLENDDDEQNSGSEDSCASQMRPERCRVPIRGSLGNAPIDPHLLCCQIWRWPDLAHPSELKRLPVCHSAKDPVYICCNPYHWSRLCKPESPPPPYCLIADRLRPEDRAPSEGDQRRCKNSTPVPLPGSLTTNGEGETGQKEWCTLAYWELGGRVGRLYPVEPSTVNVFDSLHDGDGLCLATLAENHVASPAVQRTRSKIGLGLMLSQETDGVWAYNRSESPIFVNSPTLDDPESRTLLVYRVPPGFCLNIFDRTKILQLPYGSGNTRTTSQAGGFASGPVDINSVRISFAKGWGPKYSRQEVTSCPCWLEVLLAPCR
ncbi:Mothers against decapentaplegic like protein 6 [Dufourea novaeangliae]|uniref:Mothers against decapentaplegic homolog n=1 Tax=Dufourea novaeangliae TaxID=178035 RepID=A0A154NYQ8_DUFNO|nr:Mothers against decapentaplegic like protein 6 [Dufourea novaeangliae]